MYTDCIAETSGAGREAAGPSEKRDRVNTSHKERIGLVFARSRFSPRARLRRAAGRRSQ
jgi:hypothetical protein